jgi:serine protease Do
MKSRLVSIILLLSIYSGHTYGQQFDHRKLEASVQESIKNAYAASVRIWGFDVDKQARTSGQFSGVVVSAEGHIFTAAHVNVPGNTYKIMFPDGTSQIARGLGEIELEGNRSVPDVAMMKIIGQGKWPYAKIGWSYSLKKDEPCISIAYPETLNQSLPTVRFGYVAEPKNKYGFIRSTCLMEPGDSGGPLFDRLGRLIGMHSAIDISENDNFEVPVDLYRKYWTALNKPETYKTYPVFEDAIGIDPLVAKIKSIPGLESINQSFAKNAAKLESVTCLIKSNVDGKLKQVQGTVFQPNAIALKDAFKNRSFLIAKSSLVGDQPIVEFLGKQVQVTIIARDREKDLILLMASSKLKGGIKLAQPNPDTLKFDELGKLLLSPLFDGTYKISIIGSLEFTLPKIKSSGFLGAGIGYESGNLRITFINPNTPASDGKLAPGDKILGLNGTRFDNPDDFFSAYQKYWPGDEVALMIGRKKDNQSTDTVLHRKITLGTVPERNFDHPAEKFAGGKSDRRDGFDRVFTHDALLKPEDCGGAVFDFDGHFYGINIARFSRTSTITIPAWEVIYFILKYTQFDTNNHTKS